MGEKGTWLMTKRLEEGTFCRPKADDVREAKLALRPEAFAMLADGIDLRGAKLRPWHGREGWVDGWISVSKKEITIQKKANKQGVGGWVWRCQIPLRAKPSQPGNLPV